MRRASEAAREIVHILLQSRLHGLHGGDTGKNNAEVGFQGCPEGVDGGVIIDVTIFEIVYGDYAERGYDTGADL